MSDLVVIGSVQFLQRFASPLYRYLFRCSDESEVPFTIGDMLPSGYYAYDTQAIIARNTIECSDKVEASHADVDSDVALLVTAPINAAPDDAGTAVQLTKFNVAHSGHSDLLVRAN